MVECRLVGDHLVHQADAECAIGVEALAGDEQGTRVRLADLRHHERADDRRDDAELRLGEAECRVGRRDDDVGNRAQAHAAPERRALDPRDHRRRTAVDGREHRVERGRVPFVLLDAEADRGSHPVDVGTGTEDRTGPGQHDAAQDVGTLRRELFERCPQLADELRVEGVADVGTVEGDPGERPFPLEAQAAHRPRPRRWNGSATARTCARSGSSSQTTSVPSGTSTVADVPGSPTSPSIRRRSPLPESVSTR